MAIGTGVPNPAVGVALASAADLVTFGYPAAASDFLVRASVRVREYVDQDINAGTDTVSLRYPFLLPQRPVTAITSVTWANELGSDAEAATHTLTADTDYRLEGQYLICPAYKDKLLTVVYTFGFTAIPDALKDVVCAIAARMAAAPAGLSAGFQTEAADGETISYGSDAYSGVAELTRAEKRRLDRIFPHSRRVPSVAVTM